MYKDAKCSKGHDFAYSNQLPHNCPVCVNGVPCKGVTSEVVVVKKERKERTVKETPVVKKKVKRTRGKK